MKQVWEANDGKVFYSKQDCEEHENRMRTGVLFAKRGLQARFWGGEVPIEVKGLFISTVGFDRDRVQLSVWTADERGEPLVEIGMPHGGWMKKGDVVRILDLNEFMNITVTG